MILWDLPSGWAWKSVGSVADDTSRQNPKSMPDALFRYVDIGSVDNEKGLIKLEEVRTIEGKKAPSRARKVIHESDVIIATTRPYLRNIALVPEILDDQICSTGFCVIRPIEGLADSRYLYFACRSQFFINQLIPKQRGANYPAVTDSDVYETQIPVPFPDNPERSLVEQRRIVARIEALLAEVREMRKLHGEITADTNALMDAIRAENFYQGTSLPNGWKLRRIDSFSEVNPRRPQITRGDMVPTSFVPMAAIDEVRGAFSQVESKPYHEVRRGFTYFEKNDVVFAKITPSMQNGKSAVASNLIDGFGFGTTEFHVIRSDGSVLPEWIHQFVRQKFFLQEAMGHFRGAVGQQRVPAEFLASYEIPIPFPKDVQRSLSIQLHIIKRMQAMQAEVWQMQADIAAEKTLLGNIEQAILSQAFRGEL